MRAAGFKGLIIGMSGDVSCNEFLQSGANCFLSKPLSRKELLNALLTDATNENTISLLPSTEAPEKA